MKENINNFYFKTAIAIGLLVTVYGYISSNFLDNYEAENFIYIGLKISEIAGLLMLLFNGTFIKTKFFRILKVVVAVIIVGIMAKISHKSYSDEILISGFVSIIFIYFISFIKKPIKKRPDYLKLLWVVVAFSIVILRFLHQISDEYTILSGLLMWLVITDYMLRERKSNSQPKSF